MVEARTVTAVRRFIRNMPHKTAPPKAQLLLSGCYYYTCKTKKRRESTRLFLNEFTIYSLTENWSLPTEQRGPLEISGNVFPFRAGGKAVFGRAFFLVIFPAANVAYVSHYCNSPLTDLLYILSRYILIIASVCGKVKSEIVKNLSKFTVRAHRRDFLTDNH